MVRTRFGLRLVVLLGFAGSLAACQRGPDPEALRSEVQRRLDGRFEEGLFEVEEFHRRGSAPFRDPEKGKSGLFVYYDATFEFQRDYDLASWRGLNLGTLAYVVGATPLGVQGFEAAGNRGGDLLRVHGRLAWQDRDGAWTSIEAEPPPRERSLEPAAGAGPASLLRSIRALVAERPATSPDTPDAAIVYELRNALALMDLRSARLAGALVLGTGQPLGTYYEFGRAFARHATQQGLAVHAHPSDGSVANGFGLQAGRLDFGLVQSDVAEALYEGVQGYDLPLPELRSVASLWPEAVHVVALEGSGIERFDDLRGRRVALGRLGSGTRLNALQLGRAIGLRHRDFEEVREAGVAESMAALEAGEVDAVFVTEAIPSRAIQDLTRRRDDVHFISVEEAVLEKLAEGNFAYYGLTVPARTYPGQETSFRALALAAALVTRAKTPDEAVEQILTMLIEGSEALSHLYYRAAFISSETMRLGLALPLHPAAARYYDSRDASAEAKAREKAAPDSTARPAGERG